MGLFSKPTRRLEIELATHCVSKCSQCPRTITIEKGEDDPGWNAGFLAMDDVISLIESDGRIRSVNFCGAYGDPIYHPKLAQIVDWIGRNRPQIWVNIETNGSHRSPAWWEDLGRVLKPRHQVTFSVDGLGDTNAVYRRGTDWDSILEGIRVLRRTSPQAKIIWKWIVFKHNQHQVEEGARLARELGVNSFRLIDSERHDENSRPTLDIRELEAQIQLTGRLASV